MPYNPLRYYVPLIPAYILLMLEWLHGRWWQERDVEGEVSPTRLLALPLLVWITFVAGLAVNRYLLKHIPVAIGEDPGLSDGALHSYFYPVFLPASIVGGLVLWRYRRRLLEGSTVRSLTVALVAFSFAADLWIEGRFLLHPSFRVREISAALEEIIEPDLSVAGDFAPLFALGTRLKAVMMGGWLGKGRFNPATRIRLFHPDYFIYCGTPTSADDRRVIEETDGLTLGPPLYRSSYAEREIVLYALTWADEHAPKPSGPPLR